jgi:ABC-2 type transport system permease protein
MPGRTLWAFFRRDALIHTSYKVGFFVDLAGVFFTAATYYFVSRVFGAAASPFLKNYGGDYFAFVLIGVAFAAYQNVGLNSFSQSLRQEQFLNTLEPLLMTPVNTPRFLVGSSLWDFLYATIRVALYLILGALFFGFRMTNARVGPALAVLVLTLFAFMGLGVFAASFIMRFKRGNPVTWFMEAASNLLGGVFFPLSALAPGPSKGGALDPHDPRPGRTSKNASGGGGMERGVSSIDGAGHLLSGSCGPWEFLFSAAPFVGPAPTVRWDITEEKIMLKKWIVLLGVVLVTGVSYAEEGRWSLSTEKKSGKEVAILQTWSKRLMKVLPLDQVRTYSPVPNETIIDPKRRKQALRRGYKFTRLTAKNSPRRPSMAAVCWFCRNSPS